MKRSLSLLDVKQALLDSRFREILPEELLPDVQKFLSNPGCGCNHPIYRKVMKVAAKQLNDYFPNKEIVTVPEEKTTQDEWQVINCNINDLQNQLRRLPPGKHNIEVARYQEQVTVVVHTTDIELAV